MYKVVYCYLLTSFVNYVKPESGLFEEGGCWFEGGGCGLYAINVGGASHCKKEECENLIYI